jgi:uncharacterized lipoprotein YehR (DUF1307 family)
MLTNRNLAISFALVSVFALAACGGSDTSSTSTPSTATTNVTSTATDTTAPVTTGAAITTGSASCTKAEITKAVSDLSSSDYADAKLATGGGPSYKCADGWAVGFVDVGMGMEQYTTTVVWQAEGQFWVPQDRAKVCPKPSQVPAAIYDLACNSN